MVAKCSKHTDLLEQGHYISFNEGTLKDGTKFERKNDYTGSNPQTLSVVCYKIQEVVYHTRLPVMMFHVSIECIMKYWHA